MRQIFALALAYCFSGCLGCTLGNVPEIKTYEGGTIIKIRKYLWGGSMTLEDRTNNKWDLKGLKFNPETKSFELTSAAREADASGPMEAYAAYMPFLVQGQQNHLEGMRVQQQALQDSLMQANQMLSTIASAVPGIMAARPQQQQTPDLKDAILPLLFNAYGTGSKDSIGAAIRALGHEPPQPQPPQ